MASSHLDEACFAWGKRKHRFPLARASAEQNNQRGGRQEGESVLQKMERGGSSATQGPEFQEKMVGRGWTGSNSQTHGGGGGLCPTLRDPMDYI